MFISTELIKPTDVPSVKTFGANSLDLQVSLIPEGTDKCLQKAYMSARVKEERYYKKSNPLITIVIIIIIAFIYTGRKSKHSRCGRRNQSPHRPAIFLRQRGHFFSRRLSNSIPFQ